MKKWQKAPGGAVASQRLNRTFARVPEQWLWPIRGVIVLVALFALVVFGVDVLLNVAHFRMVCAGVSCADRQLSLEGVRVLHAWHLSLDAYVMINVVFLLLQALVYYGVAALILWHRSDEWLAVCVAVGFLADPTNALAQPVLPCPSVVLVPLEVVQFLGIASFILTCFLFPNGRFVPPWTRLPAVFGLVMVGLQTFFPEVTLPLWVAGANWVSAFSLLIFAQIYRYRRVSSREQRQQTRWVVFGVAGASLVDMVTRLLPLLFSWFGEPGSFSAFLSDTVSTFGFLLLPLTIGFAILRFRLWDIDVIIRRTLVYGGLSISIIALYVLLVAGLGAVLRAEGTFLISLVATGLIAVLFQPLRELLQRSVNRLLYGQRDEPYLVITRLSQRLKETLESEAVLSTIVETVAQALKLPYAAICWKQEGIFELAASYGKPAGEPLILPLVYQTETIGQLQLTPRTPGEPFTPADLRLLDELARQAGLAAHAVRLATDLQQARERLVLAREEERRRLRRDLHDGIGPTLASLSQRIDTACYLVACDPEAALLVLGNLKAQIKATIGDVRRVVYALRPPVLDELGLVSAIHEHMIQLQGTRGLHLSLETPTEMPLLPAAVEVAVYRITLEALTNVERHAQALHCLVRLELLPERFVCLSILDDGRGLPDDYHAGVGLTSIRERVAELGGELQLSARPGGGTHLQVRLCLRLESKSVGEA